MNRAKELFNLYHGNLLQMHRGGVLSEYKKYEITKVTETEWFQESINVFTSQLSIRNWEAIASLDLISKNYQESSILSNAIAFTSKNVMSSDSIVKLMYAENIISIMKNCIKVIANDLLFDSCRCVVRILEDIISSPLVLDPGHELSQFALKDKKTLNMRAGIGIEEIKGILSNIENV